MHQDTVTYCLIDLKIVRGLTTGGETILRESEKWKIAIAYVLQRHAL